MSSWAVVNAATLLALMPAACAVVMARIWLVVSAAICTEVKASRLLDPRTAKSSVSIATSCRVLRALTLALLSPAA